MSILDLAGATGNASKQLGEIVGVQPVQRASQTDIIEHLSRDSWPKPSVRRECPAKNCDTRYNSRRLHPNPLSTIATLPVPTPTRLSILGLMGI